MRNIKLTSSLLASGLRGMGAVLALTVPVWLVAEVCWEKASPG